MYLVNLKTRLNLKYLVNLKKSIESVKVFPEVSKLVGIVGADPCDIDLLLQTEQMRDDEVRTLRQKLEKGEIERFVLIDGIIYRKNDNGRLCLYAPTQMQEQLIRLSHEKCVDDLKNKHWFPLLRSKVEYFMRNCLLCILHSVPKSVHDRTLYSIPKVPIPFDTIHIDHLVPLPCIN